MSTRRGIALARSRRQAGFTLIEIIVAFAVLALGLTLLLGTLSGASRQLRDAGDAGKAALIAQTVLAANAETLNQPMRLDGEAEEGRYRWQLEVALWQDPRLQGRKQPIDPGAARMLRVQLDVQWGDGGPRQQLRVVSLRLAARPPAGDAP
ncbi:prepilin-type N-terminal cleavage/methylation domain-containing protein [Thermomonas sp.]|uniref:type II secretion system protein XpsI n=1 Tax=Thermomonas sp. TaxID=1971895 RepID=UPI0026367600|nr:prepilin-type N-terminal cleavage/methylation domain-containing protein [Thermomonas sp.]